jgi:hypothetical protein
MEMVLKISQDEETSNKVCEIHVRNDTSPYEV